MFHDSLGTVYDISDEYILRCPQPEFKFKLTNSEHN